MMSGPASRLARTDRAVHPSAATSSRSRRVPITQGLVSCACLDLVVSPAHHRSEGDEVAVLHGYVRYRRRILPAVASFRLVMLASTEVRSSRSAAVPASVRTPKRS